MTTSVPILLMKKLGHRKVRSLVQANSWSAAPPHYRTDERGLPSAWPWTKRFPCSWGRCQVPILQMRVLWPQRGSGFAQGARIMPTDLVAKLRLLKIIRVQRKQEGKGGQRREGGREAVGSSQRLGQVREHVLHHPTSPRTSPLSLQHPRLLIP